MIEDIISDTLGLMVITAVVLVVAAAVSYFFYE